MHWLLVAIVLGGLSIGAQPLRQLADARGIKIGAAAVPSRLSEAAYAEALAREFNQLQAENAMKFGPIHPEQAKYNFAPADALVDFARDHNMAVRGHTLVWHRQNPAWLTQGNFTPE